MENASNDNRPQESHCFTSKVDCTLSTIQMTAAIQIPLSDVHARESHEATDVTQSLAPIRSSKELPRMGSLQTFFLLFLEHGVRISITFRSLEEFEIVNDCVCKSKRESGCFAC